MNNEIINLLNEIELSEKLLEENKIKINNLISLKNQELKSYRYGFEYDETYGGPYSFNIDLINKNIVVEFQHTIYDSYDNDEGGGSGPQISSWGQTYKKEIVINYNDDILFSDINLGKWLDLELFKNRLEQEKCNVLEYKEEMYNRIKRYNNLIEKSNKIIENTQKIIDSYKL
jgi:hypothetical protein